MLVPKDSVCLVESKAFSGIYMCSLHHSLCPPFILPPTSSLLLLPSSSSLLPPPLLLPPPSLLLRAPQEPSTPTTPSDTRGLDVVDDSGALEGTPHDELVSMLRKQQQTALRYKRRFSEVKSQSICLLTYPPVSVCLSVCLSKSICFPICLFIHVRCPSI